MPWRQFSMELGQLEPSSVEAVLQAHGAQAITYMDAADSPVLEPGPGETPLWPATRVTALFDLDLDPATLELALIAGLGLERPPRFHVESLEDRVWEREWLKDFRATRFGRRLWVCPGGLDAPQDDAVVLRLDPGLAFGTGSHATTALCLEWLDCARLHQKSVLDFGAGSGILAIAALLLGAAQATAVDIDPQALEATRNNAERNSVSDRLTVRPADGLPARQFDVVLANILAAPLIELAPALAAHTLNGGELVLSGILTEQAEDVLAAYSRWYRLEKPVRRDRWLLISGRRRQD